MEVPITKFGADHRVLHPVDNGSEAQGRLPDVIELEPERHLVIDLEGGGRQRMKTNPRGRERLDYELMRRSALQRDVGSGQVEALAIELAGINENVEQLLALTFNRNGRMEVAVAGDGCGAARPARRAGKGDVPLRGDHHFLRTGGSYHADSSRGSETDEDDTVGLETGRSFPKNRDRVSLHLHVYRFYRGNC